MIRYRVPVWTIFAILVSIAITQDAPSYSSEYLPETEFTCRGKSNGGYYADIETDCQMYHVCSRDKHGVLRSTRFLCGNGTVFDQRHLVCQDYRRVQRCKESGKHYKTLSDYLETRGRIHKKYGVKDSTPAGVDIFPLMQNAPRNQIPQDAPSYSAEYLPETRFTCRGKSDGGYYADIQTDCQMYHVCSKDKHGVLRSTRFLCGNGTVFDQRHLVCQDYRRVQRCKESRKLYRKGAPRLDYLETRGRTPEGDRRINNDANLELTRLN